MMATGLVMCVLGFLIGLLFEKAYLKYDGVVSNIFCIMSGIFAMAGIFGVILMFCGIVKFMWVSMP